MRPPILSEAAGACHVTNGIDGTEGGPGLR